MRRDAREIAFKMIFSYLFKAEKDLELEKELIESNEFRVSEEDVALVDDIYGGVIDHIDELDEIISQHAKGYKLERIYKTDRALLLLALYEIKYRDDIPNVVSVNEALELAKKYGEEKSVSFINGVLSGAIKQQ